MLDEGSLLKPTQANRSTSVKMSLELDTLLFHRMSTTETLGGLFAFELDLFSVKSEIKFQDMLG